MHQRFAVLALAVLTGLWGPVDGQEKGADSVAARVAAFDAAIGEKRALKALQLPHIDEVPQSLAAALRALGTRRDPKYIATFEKYVDPPRVDVVKAAVAAMGEYFGEKEAVRKLLVGSLILAYESSGTGPNPGTSGPRRKLVDHEFRMLVRHDFQVALARLTGGVHFDRAEEWTDWYRDAKTRKWRDGLDKVDIKLDGLQPAPPGH